MTDLSDFLKSSSSGLVDHDWLVVDPEEYAKTEALPLQNLDIVPDLSALWDHQDKPATSYLLPNSADKPKSMVDVARDSGQTRQAAAAEVVRTARLLVLQTTDERKIYDGLIRRFPKNTIASCSSALKGVFAERGLLGRFYVAASDFPECHFGRQQDMTFVKRHASTARFLLAKDECSSCVQNKEGNCAVFHKRLVPTVPYTDENAETVERTQAIGKQASASRDPKDRIRHAFLSKPVASNPIAVPVKENPAAYLSEPTGHAPAYVPPPTFNKERAAVSDLVEYLFKQGRITVEEVHDATFRISCASSKEELANFVAHLETLEAPDPKVYNGPVFPRPKVTAESIRAGFVAASDLLRKQTAAAEQAVQERKARPIIALLRKEMLKGAGIDALKNALSLAFDPRDLIETRESWLPLFQKAGFLGTLYTEQGLFSNCHDGVSFLNKYASPVRYVIAGQKCTGCVYNKIGKCLLYRRPLLKDASEVMTPTEVAASLDRLTAEGKISPGQFDHIKTENPEKALRMAYKLAHRKARIKDPITRMDVYHQFVGSTPEKGTSDLTRREIVTATRRYMNEGLYGKALGTVLRKRFDPRDLAAAREDLKATIPEQGLAGIYYVDPTVYPDYGKGCAEPSRLFKATSVPYLKVGPACGGCIHQTRPGFCAKISKPLVVEPPYENKRAVRAAVLASPDPLVVEPEHLINYGANMLVEFQMQNTPPDIEWDEGPTTTPPLDISLTGPDLGDLLCHLGNG